MAPSAKNVVIEFLKYGGCELRDELLKIMSVIFEKGEVPSGFRNNLTKTLYKTCDKRERGNYRGIS